MTLPLFKALEQLQTDIGNPVEVKRWPGGQSNRLYRLNAKGRDMALRLNHPNPNRLGVDRHAERRLLAALAAKAWTPTLLEADNTWLLTEWQPGGQPASGEETDLDSLAQLMREVHSTRISGRTLNIAQQIAHLERWAPPFAPTIKTALQRRCQAYRFPEQAVLCHHDWHPGNLIEHEAGWTLLDWEFAALGDPAMDLAAACLGFALSVRQREHLRQALGISEDRLSEASCLMEALSVVWYQANPDLLSGPAPSLEGWYRRWELLADQRR